MPDYHITWTIELEADNPREAAKAARALLLDPHNIASVFDVREDRIDDTSTIYTIDALEDDEPDA
jgi:hypothetical protein